MSTHDATPAASSVRKVALASSLGATIEWYDFFIYGTASALVFNKLFFSNVLVALLGLAVLAFMPETNRKDIYPTGADTTAASITVGAVTASCRRSRSVDACSASGVGVSTTGTGLLIMPVPAGS
jgi:hypothetical protein